MDKIKIEIYSDPDHAWFKVPMEEIEELGIRDQITTFSYMSSDQKYGFLEEDQDGPLFVKKYCEKMGVTFSDFKEVTDVVEIDNAEWVRDLPSFR